MKGSELIGKRFGLLTVIDRAEGRSGRRFWVCLCECGAKTIVGSASLSSGNTKSCGCQKIEMLIERSSEDAVTRFQHSYTIQENGCWLWNTRPAKNRYASFYINNQRIPAHRASWTLFRGGIPRSLHVLHKCDVPLCVNPDHLFLGTHIDNMADMKAKGRARSPSGDDHWARRSPEKLVRGPDHPWHGVQRRGESNPRAKLTNEQVADIKARIERGDGDVAIAKDFDVRPGAIWFIRTGKHWSFAA